MTAETARTLAQVLTADDVFEFVANTYADAYDNGGGLEDVITALNEVQS